MSDISPEKYDFSSKSWVELCDEFETAREKLNNFGKESSSSEEETHCENIRDECSAPPVTPEKEADRALGKERGVDVNFSSYAHALRGSKVSDTLRRVEVYETSPAKNRKLDSERQKDFLQDDLSLTSHLDVFHMTSPCKGKSNSQGLRHVTLLDGNRQVVDSIQEEDADEERTPNGKKSTPRPTNFGTKHLQNCDDNDDDSIITPNGKESVDVLEGRGGKRRLPMSRSCDSPLAQTFKSSPAQKLVPDDVLMPSPSKLIRGNIKSEKSPAGYRSPHLNTNSRKRQREWNSPMNRHKKEVEMETDPVILERRQKQIDYGKNTIGYERYIAEVPKGLREKNHPKTPPRNVKYSRRAWDGLIKVWRKRLHYWDPPSEGGGNPHLLEADDSELSSCESMSQMSNSVPSTPHQEYKRWKGRESESSIGGSSINRDLDEDDGCRPLAEFDYDIELGDDDVDDDNDFDNDHVDDKEEADDKI